MYISRIDGAHKYTYNICRLKPLSPGRRLHMIEGKTYPRFGEELVGFLPEVAKVSSNSLQIGERFRWAHSWSHDRVFFLRWFRREVNRRKLL